MEVEFWGVRGTAPAPGKDYVKYGGNTLSSSVLSRQGEIIIVDSGTGIKMLGDKLLKEKREGPLVLSLLLTHFHLDHIIGLPFFGPLYSPQTVITFYAPAEPDETEKHLDDFMSTRYFPVALRKTKSKKVFKKVDKEKFVIGEIHVSTYALHHPQGSVAYKLEEKGNAVVFATDAEHPEKGEDKRFVAFVRGARCLICDSMFTPEEYQAGRQGWGHSTWLEGIKIAQRAEVESLYLSHLNPEHSDKKVDEIIRLARKIFPKTYAAREGLKLIF